MNKELKFRVWCTQHSEWEKDKVYLAPNGQLMTEWNGGRLAPISQGDGFHIVERYLGIDDKNKVPLFEGDIIVTKFDEICLICVNALGTIASYDRDGSTNHFDLLGLRGFKIIGNIHENPELLTASEAD